MNCYNDPKSPPGVRGRVLHRRFCLYTTVVYGVLGTTVVVNEFVREEEDAERVLFSTLYSLSVVIEREQIEKKKSETSVSFNNKREQHTKRGQHFVEEKKKKI
jgi:hypothetical protein